MSLFGSVQMAGNTLQAMQIGLQVVGNNISNANTPGYVRQQANFTPAGIQKQGSLILGLGVKVDSITQQVDKFVQARLIGAHGDTANANVQNRAYKDLETLLNELSTTTDLSSSLTGFFNSINDVLNASGSAATKNLAIGKGVSLSQNINNLHNRVADVQNELDDRVTSDADQINNLSEQIRQLNVKIASIEGGNTSASEAGGLRVQRQTAVDKLSQILGIQVSEQPSGGLNISVGGELLVFEGQRNAVQVSTTALNGNERSVVQFVGSHAALDSPTGELRGLYTARDQIVGGFLDKLDGFAKTLAFEFNKVYSQGQGQVGFSQLTSQEAVSDPSAALDAAGLPFTPHSGNFDIIVRTKSDNSASSPTKTTQIKIDLDGLDGDTSLSDLAKQLNAVDGISATVTPAGKLQIKADSADIDFAFSGDTSGVLASLGVNTFFTGSSAATLGVNNEIKGIDNASKFAASTTGIGIDFNNAVKLATLLDQPLDSNGGTSISDQYTQIINEVTQGSSVAASVADGYQTFESSLEGQEQAVSGVSIDEEAVNMMTLQRVYQASAKYISTISELLDELMKL